MNARLPGGHSMKEKVNPLFHADPFGRLSEEVNLRETVRFSTRHGSDAEGTRAGLTDVEKEGGSSTVETLPSPHRATDIPSDDHN